MTVSAYALKRRLIESEHTGYAKTLELERGIPKAVTIEALIMLNGDRAKLDGEIDYLGFDRTVVMNDAKCAALLNRVRRLARRA